MSLDPKSASELLEGLTPAQIKALSIEMARIYARGKEETKNKTQVIGEFHKLLDNSQQPVKHNDTKTLRRIRYEPYSQYSVAVGSVLSLSYDSLPPQSPQAWDFLPVMFRLMVLLLLTFNFSPAKKFSSCFEEEYPSATKGEVVGC